MKDVKNITDIPDIENLIYLQFSLELYETGDCLAIYKSKKDNGNTLTLEIITDESLILGHIDLAEIIAHYDIAYLELNEFDSNDVVVSEYMFRPLIDEELKNY